MVDINISNMMPASGTKQYGLSVPLSLVATVSGTEPSYLYDTSFYKVGEGKIGSTISGTTSGQTVSGTITTISGEYYYWYAEVVSSGTTVYSDTYSFYVRYLCSGTVNHEGSPKDDVAVRLYRRSDGSLVAGTTSSGGGNFAIDTQYNEQHYAIALPTASGMDSTNALIYDQIQPT